jgi:DnaK suppressor protein
MQQVQLSEYKRMLEARAHELSRGFSLDRLAVQKTAEVMEEAQMMMEQDLAVVTRNQEFSALRLIWDALDRIAEGTYGSCLSCGNAIPTQRLRALPWAPLCIHCQELVDSGQTGMLVEPAVAHAAPAWRNAA